MAIQFWVRAGRAVCMEGRLCLESCCLSVAGIELGRQAPSSTLWSRLLLISKQRQSNALMTKARLTKCPNFIEPSTWSLISFILLLMLSDCWFSNDHNSALPVFIKRFHQLLCLMEITNLRNSGFWVEKCIDPWSLRSMFMTTLTCA